MARQRRVTTFASYLPLILMGVTALGMLGLSGVAVAWLVGVFDGSQSQPVDRTGQLAFPALSRPVKAFERLTRDDFVNPQTGQVHVMWLPEASASVAMRDMRELLGRVVRRDKQANMVLSEADLLEKGTRPGLAAGIPPTKVAMAIPASNITGLEQLRNGDRFDLLVALPERETTAQISNSEPAVLFGGVKPPSLRVGQLSRQHGVKRLVTNGMLVTLYTKTSRSTTGRTGLTVVPNSSSKAKTTTTVVAEVAVDEEEIGPLTEAISLGTALKCVIRSGQPMDAQHDEFNPAGLVPVITTSKLVAAFSALSDENLIDEATGQLHLYYFPAEKVSESWLTDPTELYGRVVSRQLRRGSLITEDDLLPVGTRPGISAGLPVGTAALSVSKAQVQGFEKLVIGDRFSILTRVPEAVGTSLPSVSWATLQGGRLAEDDARLEEMVRTGIREVARDAVYLSDPDDSNVVIGISQQEVAKLAQLLRDDSELFVVANSSRGFNSDRDDDKPTDKETEPGDGPPIPSPDSSARTANGTLSVRLVSQVTNDRDQQVIEGRDETIPVPVLVRDVTAFRLLTIDDFVDPATGRIRMLYFPRDKIHDQWVKDIRELVDRVAVRSLRSGRVVSQGDLAPPGTPAGPAVGIPAGMRGVTVNSAQILGLEQLSEGSIFDLATAGAVDVQSLADEVRQSLASPDAVQEAAKLPSGRVSTSRAVASSVVLLADLGESLITIQTAAGPSQVQRITRLAPDGSTITEEVVARPAFSSEQRSVRQYVLAIPEASATAVLGMLDVQDPLVVSLLPLGQSNSSRSESVRGNRPSAPVRAVIQEHVRGGEVRSEVFLTDRPEASSLAWDPSGPAEEDSEGD